MPVYRCPTCGTVTHVEKPEEAPCRPFCGERCQWIDLGKWFNGEYKISDPITPTAGESDDGEERP